MILLGINLLDQRALFVLNKLNHVAVRIFNECDVCRAAFYWACFTCHITACRFNRITRCVRCHINTDSNVTKRRNKIYSVVPQL